MIKENDMTVTQQRNIPTLRFPEFSKEWVNKKIRYIAPLQRGFDLPTTQVSKGKYPVVYSNGVLRTHSEYKVVGPGVVTGRSGTIGKVTFVEEKYWPHNTSLWVTDFCGNDPKYIYYFYSQIRLEKYNAGSTVPTLNRNDVHSLKRYIPHLKEQQKIATFLSLVDTKIEQLGKKKALLEQYKKGTVQKLFSQKIRFKDENGKNYSDWGLKRLNCLASKVKKKNLDGTETHVLTNSAQYGVVEQKNYFDREIVNVQNLDGYYVVHVGDFIYNPRKSAQAPVGPIKRNHLMKGIVSPLYVIFRFHEGNLDFFEHYFNSAKWHRHIENIANYGARFDRMSIADKDLFNLPLPQLDEQEQQKIADFLSAIDRKIELVTGQIEQARVFKKGLLQQMFI